MYYLLAIFSGLLLAVQNPFNVNLGKKVRSPIQATFLIYLIGSFEFALALVILGQSPLVILIDASILGSPWILGGLLGLFYVLSIIVLFPIIGPIKAVTYPTLGQIVSGVFIDTMGTFDVKQSPLTGLRVAGVALILFAVFLATKKEAPTKAKADFQVEPTPWSDLLLLWAFLAGVAATLQGLFNGKLGAVLYTQSVPKSSFEAALSATFFAFFIGLIAMSFILIATEKLSATRTAIALRKPLSWVTASMGSAFVFLMTILTPAIGPGLTASLSIIGLMGGTMFIEHKGLFKVKRSALTARKALALILFILGIIFVKVLS
ncbi:DMT family transporter [Fructobacillus sp. M2-14]|uniref:DMT family transporter n=1 Tax=Fructobacillus broussonetiae TaxID=2713173 RepID=A0ABS5R2U0_9LACO|nr:DMT family transporter [Fructobacillus broussonetiae]MBS9338986.1 DMT family transporter [Fructobacillus broussonetiae]